MIPMGSVGGLIDQLGIGIPPFCEFFWETIFSVRSSQEGRSQADIQWEDTIH
jgi:hypothetical protein